MLLIGCAGAAAAAMGGKGTLAMAKRLPRWGQCHTFGRGVSTNGADARLPIVLFCFILFFGTMCDASLVFHNAPPCVCSVA